MTRKKLILILVAAGLVVAATSAAFSLFPPNWFAKDRSTGASATSPMTVPAPVTVPTSAAPASATPN